MKHENRGQAKIIAIVVAVLVVAAVAAYYFLAKAPSEFVCGVCGAEFDTPEELEDHMFDEHGVVPEELPREQTWYNDSGPLEYNTLNPLMGGWGETYQPLVFFDQINGVLVPILAESWEWVDDYTFEVNLRPEAQFWDGSPITADVVKWDLEVLANENMSYGLLAPMFEDVLESVKVVDDHTLHFIMNEDYAHYTIGVQDMLLNYVVFPKERWSKIIDEYGENSPEYANLDFDAINGSGPYRPVRFIQGEIAICARVDNWWANEIGWYCSPKYLAYMCYQEIGPKKWELFTQGELDWIDGTPLENLEEKFTSDKSRFQTWDVDGETERDMLMPVSGAWVLVPSYTNLPVVRDNPWIRYALAYAIPYEELRVKSGLTRNSTGSPSLTTSSKAGQIYIHKELIRETFDTEEQCGTPVIKYNPELAVKILQEHCEGSVEEGWTYNGEKIGDWVIEAPNGWVNHMTWAPIIAKAWTDIGIPTEPDYPDYTVLVEHIETRDFDWHTMGALGWMWPHPVYNFQHAIQGKPEPWWGSPVWYEKWWPEEAEEINKIIDEMCKCDLGSEKLIELTKEAQEIYVPQLVIIPYSDQPSAPGYLLDYWVNQLYKDDPVIMRVGAIGHCHTRIMTRFVETTGVELSSETVEAGEPVTVKVTLKNTGERANMYPVYVRNGPAEPGPGPEILAHTAVVVPARKTITAELTVTIDEPGTYTLTVDDWRIGKYDPGDPIEKTLTVT